MAITSRWYGLGLLSAFNKEIDWIDDDIRAALVGSGYTFDQDAHDYWNDVVANELATAGGYTANGLALSSKVLNYTAGTNVIKLSAANSQWAGASFTFRHIVLYDRTPATDATRGLIIDEQSDVDITVAGGNLDVNWNASGIGTVTPA